MIYREYVDRDYAHCEELVNQAWGFDNIFRPERLSELAKLIYTQGSVLGSNYRTVAEVDGEVVGFLFGFNESGAKLPCRWLFGLGVLWKLIRIRNGTPHRKELLSALETHDSNRSKVVAKGRSEIVLFVVSEKYRGQGLGQNLWAGFKHDCISAGVDSIVVETNKLEASSYYEKLGFGHLADFDSPVHGFATKGGQACIYEYTC